MNTYRKYKEQSIYSMSGPELLNLLFVEADRRLARAQLCLEQQQHEEFDALMTKSGEIVQYLNRILNMKYPISRDLRQIYTYLIYDISRVKAARERGQAEIGRIRHILSELREGFEGAANQVGSGTVHYAKPHEVRG